jgi:YD repeat-containing protein
MGDRLGCQISSKGVVTAGTNTGRIHVQATGNGTCYDDFIHLVEPDCKECASADCVTGYNHSVDFHIPMGGNLLGDSGYLQIKEDEPSQQLATPFRLKYRFGSPLSSLITNSSQGLRQVHTLEKLADVLKISENEYQVNLFHSSQIWFTNTGLYATSGVPHATVNVKFPVSGGVTNTNNLIVTYTPTNGSANVFDYLWLTNGSGKGWQLTTGDGLRKETRTTAWSESDTLRTITTTVNQSNGPNVFQRIEKYRKLTYGERLIEETVGTGTNALTTTYSYTTNGLTDTNGLVEKVVRSDGSWEYNAYDSSGRVTTNCSGFGNQAVTNVASLCRSIEYSYASNLNSLDLVKMDASIPRQTVEKINGVEVARRYYVATNDVRLSIQCVVTGAAWNATGNLTNRTVIYTNGYHHHEPKSILRPDGTGQVFFYGELVTTNNTTNIVFSGHIDSSGTNVDEGTKTVTVYDTAHALVSRQIYDVASQILIVSETNQYDYLKRITHTTYLDGTSMQTAYDCCGESSVTERDGTVTSYTYDALKRVLTTTRNSVTVSNLYDAAGNLIGTYRYGGTNVITTSLSAYDDAGRLTIFTNAANQAITNTYLYDSNGQFIKTTTYPDTSTRVETYYRDGSLKEISGTAAHPMHYDYGVDADGTYTSEIRLDSGGGTNEWVRRYKDSAGREYKTLFAAATTNFPFALSTFNSKGQLLQTRDPDGVSTLYSNSVKGELE